MAVDLKKLRGEVAETGKDLTKPTTGGDFDNTPAEGPTRLRLVGYIELGVHKSMYAGKPKIKPRSELTFELSGPKHEPRKTDTGAIIPYRITVKEVVGTTSKNGYIKLFNTLNVDGKAKNFLDLILDGAWRGTVTHNKATVGGQERTYANLKKDGVYMIFPTEFPDPETGELRKVSVGPAVSEPRVFLWDYPDLEQWDSLYIDGTRDDGTSKNYIQEKIKSAENFVGSPIYNLLIESGREAETVRAEKVEAPDDGGDDGEEDAKPAAASLTAPAEKPAKAPAAPAKPPKAAAKGKAAPKEYTASGDPLQGL